MLFVVVVVFLTVVVEVIVVDVHFDEVELSRVFDNNLKQAGAELCQAQKS